MITTFGKFARAAIACLLVLAACSSKEPNRTPCPSARVLAGPSQLTRFADGGGRDPVDVAFEAQFQRVSGECSYNKGGERIAVDLTVVLDVARGPAATDGPVSFSYFVAVSEKGDGPEAEPRILTRQSFPVETSFPPGRNGLRYTDVLDVTIPRGKDRAVADYVLYLGFELTPEELSYNRSKGGD